MYLYSIEGPYENIVNDHDIKVILDQFIIEDVENGFNEDKVINIGRAIKNIESEKEVIEKEIKLLKKRLEVKNKRIESLKDYILYIMQSHKVDKVRSPLFDVTVKANPVKLDIYDPELVPEEYKQKVVEIKILKDEIKNKLKNGENVPGCKLSNGYNVNLYVSRGQKDDEIDNID